MDFRTSLAQRIVIAFVLTTALVAGAFAVGTVFTVHLVEERLLSNELGGDLDRLLQMESVEQWRHEPQTNQMFYFSDGFGDFAMPDDLLHLSEGFHEIFRGEHSFYAYVRQVDDRSYVLLQDQSDFERREQLMYLVVFVGFLVCLATAGVLGWLLARKVLAPVRRLARQVLHRDQLLALAPPLAPDYAPDEVGQLAGAFDQTLRQLRDALKREQFFTADVSHELRTPLMVLASSSELLLENPNLDERARRQIRRISGACEDMRDLVQTFLQLARAESGTPGTVPQATLGEVASGLVRQWRDAIEAQGLTLEYQPGAPSTVQHNAPFLRAVLGNLLRNALHYCNEGSIRIVLDGERFVVEDTGAGIPEALRESVFEPFVRGESNRAEGLGLGLSLVRRICANENWSIRLSSVEPHGARFEVDLAPSAI